MSRNSDYPPHNSQITLKRCLLTGSEFKQRENNVEPDIMLLISDFLDSENIDYRMAKVSLCTCIQMANGKLQNRKMRN